jgi:peptidoglycan hydrolase CwlO-like protein
MKIEKSFLIFCMVIMAIFILVMSIALLSNKSTQTSCECTSTNASITEVIKNEYFIENGFDDTVLLNQLSELNETIYSLKDKISFLENELSDLEDKEKPTPLSSINTGSILQ